MQRRPKILKLEPSRPVVHNGISRSELMSRVQRTNTQPELTLRRALWREGLRYRLHPKLPGRPDFIFVMARVAVFVDGCFWHGCLRHYRTPKTNAAFWDAKIARNRERDAAVDLALGNLGWKVIRVWSHEIREDLSAAVQHIQKALLAAIRHQ